MATNEQTSAVDAMDAASQLRSEAFRMLLAHGRALTVAEIASSVGMDLPLAQKVVAELGSTGRVRIDTDGRVIGSAGLSVVPDRHRIELGSKQFWTWCAYDILGIFGALEASGRAESRSPHTGAPIDLVFSAGQVGPVTAVLFRPDASFRASCDNVYEEWCPNSNLFEDEASARAWAESHHLQGEVLGLDEASKQATPNWLPLVARADH